MGEWQPTREQAQLLAAAADGMVLITVIGSDNDILWGDFADRGLMEAADLPEGLPASLDWNAWKMTEAGKSAFAVDYQ